MSEERLEQFALGHKKGKCPKEQKSEIPTLPEDSFW